MLKSCKYCGRIHDTKFDCGRKPKRKKKYSSKDNFRSTAEWQRKREEIRQRDLNLCQCCIRNLKGTIEQYNYTDLSVHHAVPIEIDSSKRLDNSNLVTLCSRHHEMAERGEIPLETILEIIKEQEDARR